MRIAHRQAAATVRDDGQGQLRALADYDAALRLDGSPIRALTAGARLARD